MALLWRLSFAFAQTGLETYPGRVQQQQFFVSFDVVVMVCNIGNMQRKRTFLFMLSLKCWLEILLLYLFMSLWYIFAWI